MKRRIYSASCLALALAGCGGRGGGASSIPLVPFQATTIDAGTNRFAYSYGVLDDGYVLGSSQGDDARLHASAWPTPANLIEIPMLDSKAFSQQALAVSPNRRYIVGRSIDVNNSGGPGRGFIFDVQTLALKVIDFHTSDTLEVIPTSVTDDREIVGTVRDFGPGSLPSSRFHYDAKTDAVDYLIPTIDHPADPDYPEATNRVVSRWSANGRFAVGSLTFGDQTYGAIWDLQNHTYLRIGTPDQNLAGYVVSDDGTVAVFYRNDAPFGSFLWLHGRLYNLIDLLREKNLASDWTRLNFVTISPNGRYISAIGMRDINYRSSVRISLR